MTLRPAVPLLLALAACAGDGAPEASVWSACDGPLDGLVTRDASGLLVADLDGDAVLVAGATDGMAWIALDDTLAATEPLGSAPFAKPHGASVFAARADAPTQLTLAGESGLMLVTDGLAESVLFPWSVADAAPNAELTVTNAWFVDGEVYVAYAEGAPDPDGFGEVWTARLGRADAAGVLTPLLTFADGLSDDASVTGAWDPDAGTFVLTLPSVDGTVWRVRRDGTIAARVDSDVLPALGAWVPLGEGRWAGAFGTRVVVFDPDVPGSRVDYDRADAEEPVASGTLHALPRGGAFFARHVGGMLAFAAWDGADLPAGATTSTPFTFLVCDPFAGLPPMSVAR